MPSFDLLFPARDIGSVLGRNGEFAQRLVVETGVAIELLAPPSTSFFSSPFEPCAEKFCVLTAQPDKALKGLHESDRAVRVSCGDTHNTHTATANHCPATEAVFKLYARLASSERSQKPFRVLVKKNTCDVRFVCQKTGANVRVLRIEPSARATRFSTSPRTNLCHDDSDTEVVEICANQEVSAKLAAMRLVLHPRTGCEETETERNLEDGYSRNNRKSQRRTKGRSDTRKELKTFPQKEQTNVFVTTLTLSIPSSLVRLVVGKGGATIQQVRRESGAKVKLHDASPGCAARTLELGGETNKVTKAKALVIKALESASFADES